MSICLFFSFIILPTAAYAEDVCCKCTQKSDADKKTVCIQISAVELTSTEDCSILPTNTDLGTNWECQKTPLTGTQCRTIDQDGVCSTAPQKAALLKASTGDTVASGGQTKTDAPPIIPNFNVDIPGFEVPSDPSIMFGAYVSAVYRYLISISVIIATVMFIWGGFVYLIGSSGIASIQTGKSIMLDAVIGLILLFSANLILRTLNPNLVTFNSLNIEAIKTLPWQSRVSSASIASVLGANPPKASEMLRLTKEVAKQTGIAELPCIVYASMINESGGKFVVGHDESFQSDWYNVKSRRAFLQSGVKHSGETFTPVACGPDPSCQKNEMMNDDLAIDLTKPPDYGIDWRFSHGLGPAQSTIFPDPLNPPCAGREEEGKGFRMGSKCYTVPELFDAQKVAQIITDHFKACFRTARGDVARTFVCYAGNITVDNPAIIKRMKDYEACRGSE